MPTLRAVSLGKSHGRHHPARSEEEQVARDKRRGGRPRDLAGRPATRAARRRPATTRAAAFRNRVDERTRQSALAAGVI